MIADIGTRKGGTLQDIDSNSTWINGYNWMKSNASLNPVKSMHDIYLDVQDISLTKKECI